MNATLKGTLVPSHRGTLRGTISANRQSLSVSISGSQIDTAERYEGNYDITPRAEPQVLETRAKKMISNLTIEGVPHEQVTNSGGGYTVTIL